MPTYKTYIIEQFFRERYNEETKTLTDPVVTLKEVQGAIAKHNIDTTATNDPTSEKNPANFFKDFYSQCGRGE